MRAAFFFYAVVFATVLTLGAAAARNLGENDAPAQGAVGAAESLSETADAPTDSAEPADTASLDESQPSGDETLPVFEAAGDGVITVLDGTGEIYTMTLEDYVYGAMLAEVPPSYPMAALQAMATAARTYAARKLIDGSGRGDPTHGGADLCTDCGHCMAVASARAVSASAGEAPGDEAGIRMRAAVDATAGEVLTYAGELCHTFFFAMAPSRTTCCADVFGGVLPYLVSVPSPEDERCPGFLSTVTLTRAEAAAALAAAGFPADANGAITLIRDGAGYVCRMTYGRASFSGTQARFLFGLRSAYFTVTEADDTLTFSVCGYGHGVGMSQTGASLYAADGMTHAEILAHYYPGTTRAHLAFSG